MLIKYCILALMGLAAGLSIAGGIFAFLIMIGVVPRLAGRTHTASRSINYETTVIVGGAIGNVLSVFFIHIPIGYLGSVVFGLFSGIFVGCFAMALAEILNVIPIMAKRLRLKDGMMYFLVAIAIGKMVGTWYQLCYPIWFP